MKKLAVGLVVAVLLVLVSGAAERVTLEASHGSTPGVIDAISIDMDPTGNGANGPLSSIDACKAVPIGGTISIDIVVDEVDAADLMQAFQLELNYTDTGPGAVKVTAVDVAGQMITANAGSLLVSFLGDPVPDSDGTFQVAVTDGGPIPGSSESGSGVLARIDIEGVGPAGISALSLSSVLPVAAAGPWAGVAIPVTTLAGASVAVVDVDADAFIDSSDCLVPLTPLTVPAGHDFLVTVTGSHMRVANVPAGFFGDIAGVPSDPILGPFTLDVTGLATGPLGFPTGNPHPPIMFLEIQHCDRPPIPPDHCHYVASPADVADADTIVRRDTGVALPGLGDTGNVQIETVSLSLVNASPIQVTYGGGAESSFFNVFIDLDPASVQAGGNLNLTRLGEQTGTADSSLSVTTRATFTNTNPLGPSAIGPFVQTINLEATGARWSLSLPEPVGGTVELLGQPDSPADASESSSAGDYTAPIVAAAATAMAIAVGGWYARRRWLR